MNTREISGEKQLCNYFKSIKMRTGRKIYYFLKADIICGMFSTPIDIEVKIQNLTYRRIRLLKNFFYSMEYKHN